MSMWRSLLILTALSSLSLASASMGAPTEHDRANLLYAWKPGKYIAPFTYEAHRAAELYTMAADGSDVQRLTRDHTGSSTPSWSPDGSTIAFTSNRDGDGDIGGDIYVMASDGSDVRRLTCSDGWEGHVTWSPDGSRVAYQARADRRSSIHVMTASGENAHRITDDRGQYHMPAWSPDGSLILCSSDRDSRPGLYAMHPDGSDVRWIGPAGHGRASWSPDGTRLAVSSAEHGAFELYDYTIEGALHRRVTRDGVARPNPAWHPDGSRIAYAHSVDSHTDIYVIAPDGTGRRRLTPDGSSAWPAWAPDGKRVVYTSQRDGNGTFQLRLKHSRLPGDSPPPTPPEVGPGTPGPTLRVLAVGVSREGTGRWTRRYGAADASDFAAACGRQAHRLYADVRVRLLTDEDATAQAVRAGMAWLRDASAPGDVAFAFLSMHGVSDIHGDVYLCSADADPAAPIDGVPWSDVVRILSAVSSRLVVFADQHSAAGPRRGEMLDGVAACSAAYGLLAAGRGERAYYARTVSGHEADHAWTESRRLCLWPASVGQTASVERSAWRNGAFTEALLIAMSDPATDFDADGILTELEVATVVARQVTRLTDGAQRFCPSQDLSPDLPLFAAARPGPNGTLSPEEAP